jgi:peptide/nickel transport system substrate-binding protein
VKSKFLWLILSCLMVLSLVLASCSTKTTPTTTPTTKPTTTAILTTTLTSSTAVTATTPTAGAKWWDSLGVPQYGGTLTIRIKSDPRTFDTYFGRDGTGIDAWNYETLGMADWALDRQIYNFQVDDILPQYKVGRLAENWEQPDLQTIIFHIRKGVRWWDKAPANGREFTAYDVEWFWRRQLGLGSGFTKPSSFIGATTWAMVNSVTATDKYTVVFKAKEPTIAMFEVVVDEVNMGEVNREAVEQWGDVQDWKHVIGTTPFVLDGYVSGSSLTYKKNPNYWGYDERYPQNKLPYVDQTKILIIPDDATAMAALRSGKIDMLTSIGWEKTLGLKKTNPELLHAGIRGGNFGLQIRCDKTPFTDIRVRKALQMSLDLKTIAQAYYGGTTEGIAYGLIGPDMGDLYTPFSQWPKEVHEGYTYNPEGAKKLLADAGYPKGFKTNVVAQTSDDLDLIQLVKSYFAAVGIDMEIKTMDPTTWRDYTMYSFKHDQMAWYHVGAYSYKPLQSLRQRYSKHGTNMTKNNDPVYDAIFEKALATLDPAEQKKLIKEADAYATSQQWVISTLPPVSFNSYQPWLKGYSGESFARYQCVYSARLWIDQKLK